MSCTAITGQVAVDSVDLYEIGIGGAFSLCSRPMSIEQVMEEATILLEQCAERIIRL